MNTFSFFQKVEHWNIAFAKKWGIHLLRYSLAIIYIWFGLLKPLGVSPASNLVEHTVVWFSHDWFVPALGVWEVAIGLLLLFRTTTRYAVWMIYLHLPCTFLPFFTFPESASAPSIYELTLVGQYIIKNLTLLAAAIIIGGSVSNFKTKKKATPDMAHNGKKPQNLEKEEFVVSA